MGSFAGILVEMSPFQKRITDYYRKIFDGYISKSEKDLLYSYDELGLVPQSKTSISPQKNAQF